MRLWSPTHASPPSSGWSTISLPAGWLRTPRASIPSTIFRDHLLVNAAISYPLAGCPPMHSFPRSISKDRTLETRFLSARRRCRRKPILLQGRRRNVHQRFHHCLRPARSILRRYRSQSRRQGIHRHPLRPRQPFRRDPHRPNLARLAHPLLPHRQTLTFRVPQAEVLGNTS
jgi:hypothetical protein